MLFARTDNGNWISIWHLVVDGATQWIVGRNLTRKCNLEYIGRTAIRLSIPVPSEFIEMYDFYRHSHMQQSRYIDSPSESLKSHLSSSPAWLAAVNSLKASRSKLDVTNWPSIRRIVDRGHKHVCGHATYSDMRALSDCNKLWNNQTQHYLSQAVSNCQHCKSASTPPPNRRVSLLSLNLEFKDIVFLDHFYLNSVTVLHCMDVATSFSAGAVVTSTNLETSIYNIELLWIAQFWPSSSLQADEAFHDPIFKSFLEIYDIELRPFPPLQHCKNTIEPRNSMIRLIFLRLKHAEPDFSDSVHAVRAIRISNDLYGLDTLSSSEISKGLVKPLCVSQRPVLVHDEPQAAHHELIAKRKLTLIMRSNDYLSQSIKIGDLVQIFIHDGKAKRGSWISPRKVLSTDTAAG